MGSVAPLSLRYEANSLIVLDQRKLPHLVDYLTLRSAREVRDAIYTMVVRGAPLIGIAAAFGVVLSSCEHGSDRAAIARDIEMLAASRPTAINLAWALRRMRQTIETWDERTELAALLLNEADRIYREDRETNLSIARHGMTLLPEPAAILHHCNTGSLATSDYGTALGIARYAHEQGRTLHVYLDETRPRLQGAALSAFELKHFGVSHTVIVDGASGFLMKRKRIDCVFVGCDRVARNGDFANKIGTYNLALAAKAHGVPFYVACPLSSIDVELEDGARIPIEERGPDEILTVGSTRIAPEGTQVWNPAFDVTSHDLVTGFVTERGIVRPPFDFSR